MEMETTCSVGAVSVVDHRGVGACEVPPRDAYYMARVSIYDSSQIDKTYVRCSFTAFDDPERE